MQLSFKSEVIAVIPEPPKLSLADLQTGESGIIDSLDLPADIAQRLMELGFLPDATIEAVTRAPGGDPRVFRVDGAEIALRAETAMHLKLKCKSGAGE